MKKESTIDFLNNSLEARGFTPGGLIKRRLTHGTISLVKIEKLYPGEEIVMPYHEDDKLSNVFLYLGIVEFGPFPTSNKVSNNINIPGKTWAFKMLHHDSVVYLIIPSIRDCHRTFVLNFETLESDFLY